MSCYTLTINNMEIKIGIIKLFNNTSSEFIRHINMLGLTSRFIAETLEKPHKYIQQELCIWERWHCTFYAKYGRIQYIPEKKIWIHEPKL